VNNGRVIEEDIPALNALNERLRDDYIGEVQAGVDRWNKVLERHGVNFRLRLPHKGFTGRLATSPDITSVPMARC
jgi:benzoyl-CoA 2,3-dioxygenase component B